jgi:hypothetical protein
MPSPAWTAEWQVALRRRRLLVLNAVIPLLLVAPVALAKPPAAHAAGVYAVLFVMFGVFGSAIPFIRDGAAGILTRWRLAGLAPRDLLVGRLAAQVSLDLLQALPSVAVILVSGGRVGLAPLVVGALAFSLLFANAIGVWTAALARSHAEATLFSSVLSLLLLHAAGTFRTPAPGSSGAIFEEFSPFRPLHETLLQAAGAPPVPSLDAWPPLVVALAFFGATWAAAPWLLERLRRSSDV